MYHTGHLDLAGPIPADKGQVLLPVLELAKVDFDIGMLPEGTDVDVLALSQPSVIAPILYPSSEILDSTNLVTP